MANEISAILTLSVTKSGVIPVNISINRTLSMTGDEAVEGTALVATASSFALPTVSSSIQKIVVYNADATNYIELASDNGNTTKICKVLPQEFCIFQPIGGVTVYARANTAACQIVYAVVET